MKASESRYCTCLYFSANSLARKVEKMAIENWRAVDLSPSLAYLLMIVCETPGVQPGELADELQLTPSTVTRLIQKLEKGKLIVRTFGGKLTNVYPTPKGKGLLPKLKECSGKFYRQYIALIGKEESSKLAEAMNSMADKLG